MNLLIHLMVYRECPLDGDCWDFRGNFTVKTLGESGKQILRQLPNKRQYLHAQRKRKVKCFIKLY